MMRLVTFLLLLSGVSAFSAPWGSARLLQQVRPVAFMAANDDDKTSPLVPEDVSFQQEDVTPKNVVREMNTGELKEVKWVDPYMEANTNFEMNWWGYLFLLPFVLLLDDAFHFLPKA